MKVGLIFPFRNPPEANKPFPQFYSEQLELVKAAEQLNYDGVWLTEHHFAEDGYSPGVIPIAGAISRITSRVRIGTNLMLLPLHNALQLAEEVATLDILSNGRFDLGVGQGFSQMEFDGFGIPLSDRLSRFREGIDVLRGAWTQRNFSYHGRHYNFKSVDLQPRPIQLPHPPIWVGASIPKSVARIAKMGCHYLGGKLQEVYDAALKDEGRDLNQFNSARLRWCYVAPTRDQAWDEAQDAFHYLMSGYNKLGNAAAYPGGVIPPMPAAPELRYMDMNTLIGGTMIGSPDDILRDIKEMQGEMRVTHLVLGMSMPGLDPSRSRSSMELFMKSVMPKLK